MQPKKGWVHLVALFIIVIWGTTYVSTKVLLTEGLSPEDILFYRFGLSYVFICFLGKQRLFSKTLKDEFVFFLLGIFGGSLYFLAENTALKITLVSNVALLVCTAPLLTAILSHLFLKGERLNKPLIYGSLIAFLGVSMVIFNGQFILAVNPLGDFLSIVGALSWALYTILLKQISNRYTSVFITRKVFFYGLLTILPLFLFKPLNTNIEILFQPKVLSNLLYLSLIASFFCYLFWNMTIKYLGAIVATNYIYLVPLVTLITSSVVLREEITLMALSGAFLILFGILFAEKSIRIRNLMKRK